MVCNVVTFQARSAVRDLGKALGFPMPVIERLSKTIEGHTSLSAADQILRQGGLPKGDPSVASPRTCGTCAKTMDSEAVGASDDHPIRLLADLLRQIEDCPRHLSI